MNNIKYAARQIALRPLFSIVVIGMLALGIGATTAMFSLSYQVLARPLPVPEAGRLVNLAAPDKIAPRALSCAFAGTCEYTFSYPMFRDLEARQEVFTQIAAHRQFTANLAYQDQTIAGSGALVSGGYFETLRLEPALGRLIAPSDERQIDESPVVVLTYEFWQTYFDADQNVINDTLTVNGQPLTIIGVAPEGFAGTTFGTRPQVFVPFTLRWLMEPTAPRSWVNERRAYWLYVFARLRPELSIEQASAGLNSLYSSLLNNVEAPMFSDLSADQLEQFRQRRIFLEPGERGHTRAGEFWGQQVTMLLAMAAALLLIVCVNVANLLLTRAASRSTEMAVRASMGASRGRLVGQLLTEAGALALIAGVISLPVAVITLDLFVAFLPPGVGGLVDVQIDAVPGLFAAVLTTFALVISSLIPAVRIAQTDLALTVRRHAPRLVSGRGAMHLRNVLGTSQIAFSFALLALAGTFLQSMLNIGRADLGMEVDSVVTFGVSPRLNGYGPEQAMALYERIERELAAEPGVAAITSAATPILSGRTTGSNFLVEAVDGGAPIETDAATNAVGPGFFRTLSIPLLRGRVLSDQDVLGSPSVAVVNEAFVRKIGNEADVVGRRFRPARTPEGASVEIVGVVADSKYGAIKGEAPAQVFWANRQNEAPGSMSFYVRSSIEPEALMTAIRAGVSRIDPELPVNDMMTMRARIQTNVFLDRIVMFLSTSFAALATMLAAIGLYAMLLYNITQRTQELALRLALGAKPRDLSSQILKRIGTMAAVGGAIGLLTAIGVGRTAESMLFGLSGLDPVMTVIAAGIMVAVILGASYMPVRRASNTAPMEALRYE